MLLMVLNKWRCWREGGLESVHGKKTGISATSDASWFLQFECPEIMLELNSADPCPSVDELWLILERTYFRFRSLQELLKAQKASVSTRQKKVIEIWFPEGSILLHWWKEQWGKSKASLVQEIPNEHRTETSVQSWTGEVLFSVLNWEAAMEAEFD